MVILPHLLSMNFALLLPIAFRRKPLRALYAGDSIRNFAVGLFGIFEPVYLYLLFSKHAIPHPLSWVFLFYGFYSIVFAFSSIFFAHFLPRFGYRPFVLFSFLLLFAYLLMLLGAKSHLVVLIPALLFGAVSQALFWPARHVFFGRVSSEEHRGVAFGNLAVLTGLVGITAPAFGGVMLSHFGFAFLFSVVLVLLLFAIVPYTVAEIRDGYTSSFSSVIHEFRRPGAKRAGAAFFGQGLEEGATERVWPLFLFFLAFSYEALGAITVMASAIALAATLFIGRLADRLDRQRLLVFGARLASLVWTLRVVTVSRGMAFLADGLFGLVRPLVIIPFMVLFYHRASGYTHEEQMRSVLFRELTLHSGKAVMMFVAAAWLWFDGSLRGVLIFAFPAFYLMIGIAKWARLGGNSELSQKK